MKRTYQTENQRYQEDSNPLYRTFQFRIRNCGPVDQERQVVGEPPEEPSLLASIFLWFPMLLIVLWIFFMHQMQGSGGKECHVVDEQSAC